MDRSIALAKTGEDYKRGVRVKGLVLSERDRAVFFDALAHPPKPNARLRAAFRMAERFLRSGS